MNIMQAYNKLQRMMAADDRSTKSQKFVASKLNRIFNSTAIDDTTRASLAHKYAQYSPAGAIPEIIKTSDNNKQLIMPAVLADDKILEHLKAKTYMYANNSQQITAYFLPQKENQAENTAFIRYDANNFKEIKYKDNLDLIKQLKEASITKVLRYDNTIPQEAIHHIAKNYDTNRAFSEYLKQTVSPELNFKEILSNKPLLEKISNDISKLDYQQLLSSRVDNALENNTQNREELKLLLDLRPSERQVFEKEFINNPQNATKLVQYKELTDELNNDKKLEYINLSDDLLLAKANNAKSIAQPELTSSVTQIQVTKVLANEPKSEVTQEPIKPSIDSEKAKSVKATKSVANEPTKEAEVQEQISGYKVTNKLTLPMEYKQDFITKTTITGTYLECKNNTLIVKPDAILIKEVNLDNVQKALDIAITNYGSPLTLRGSKDFQESVVNLMATNDKYKNVSFVSPELQKKLEVLKEQSINQFVNPAEQKQVNDIIFSNKDAVLNHFKEINPKMIEELKESGLVKYKVEGNPMNQLIKLTDNNPHELAAGLFKANNLQIPANLQKTLDAQMANNNQQINSNIQYSK